MSNCSSDSELEQLARGGLSAVPPARLDVLAEECERRASANGDARYSLLSSIFATVGEWWAEHDERGGVPTVVSDEIDAIILDRLPAILNADSAADGYAGAREFSNMIEPLMTGPTDWIARGYLKHSGA